MKNMKRIVAFAGFGFLFFTGIAWAAELNLATPDKYPYADLQGRFHRNGVVGSKRSDIVFYLENREFIPYFLCK